MVLVGVGAFLLTLALALALFVVPAQKKTPLDTNVTTVTDTVPGTVLVGKALGTQTPTEANKDRPECTPAESGKPAEGEKPAEGDKPAESAAKGPLPVSCFIDVHVPMYSQRHVMAVEPSDAEQITLQAAQTVVRPDKGAGESVESLVSATMDRVTLDRQSAMPSGDANSTLQLVAVGGGSEEAPGGFVRNGVQYKFPFDTGKQSYDYFDASTFTTNPIDFRGESTVGGVDVYEFQQELGPIDMWKSIRDHFASMGGGYDKSVESILSSYRRKDTTAGEWGLPGDPARKVDMHRYYTNTRTLYVNPETGQIVDGKEDIHQFFAENENDAQAFWKDKAAVAAERDHPTRTAFAFSAGWNTETIDKTGASVQESVDKLTTFGRVLPGVLALVGLLGVVAGLFLGLRRR